MANSSDTSSYEQLLGRLQGDAFQDEVCARLQSLIMDFQRIPAKPSGDGGLDGLSHGQEFCYCCYGPEQEPVKLKTKSLKDDIIKKFNADLRKLFELEFKGKSQLVHKQNEELATIMGASNKIKNIYLVLSWFQTHRVIGPLNTHFAKYKSSSQLRYIHEDATMTIWGPKDIATRGHLDEQTLFRIENRALIERIQTASSEQITKTTEGDFNAKFDDLKRRRPTRSHHIDAIAKDFREAWATSIALDNELASTSLGLHQVLETARSDAARTARVRSMGTTDPYSLIETMRAEVINQLGQGFGDRLGALTSKVADGVVAGLIGECPLEWRDDRV